MTDIKQLFDLKGQVAIVTGGHSWLGWDMACALAAFGCDIIIAARNMEKAKDAADKIKKTYHVDSMAISFDQCEPAQVQAMADQAFRFKNRIDILINNAGGGSGADEGDFFKRSPEAVINLITANLIGPIFCCQSVGRYMAEKQRGKIINIGSVAAMVGRERSMYRNNDKTEQPVDYAASKAGITGMTRDLAAYLAPYHIQVNCISPGGFDKGDLPAGFVSGYASEAMAKRMGKFGQDIYGSVLFLASSASDYVTGQNIVVDGGFSVLK